jgi:hypothetical protein
MTAGTALSGVAVGDTGTAVFSLALIPMPTFGRVFVEGFNLEGASPAISTALNGYRVYYSSGFWTIEMDYTVLKILNPKPPVTATIVCHYSIFTTPIA